MSLTSISASSAAPGNGGEAAPPSPVTGISARWGLNSRALASNLPSFKRPPSAPKPLPLLPPALQPSAQPTCAIWVQITGYFLSLSRVYARSLTVLAVEHLVTRHARDLLHFTKSEAEPPTITPATHPNEFASLPCTTFPIHSLELCSRGRGSSPPGYWSCATSLFKFPWVDFLLSLLNPYCCCRSQTAITEQELSPPCMPQTILASASYAGNVVKPIAVGPFECSTI
jgi:hypothetical protein